ncbi:MAG: hypothetical protein IEMM0003_0691 [bacterium]|nr:MAG: hypothetical protein IEMM0003_0691 [bacterium]
MRLFLGSQFETLRTDRGDLNIKKILRQRQNRISERAGAMCKVICRINNNHIVVHDTVEINKNLKTESVL